MKYKLMKVEGKLLRRLVCVDPFSDVESGQEGGRVENENDLSQYDGAAWVFGDAWVYDDAQVSGNALVAADAQVYGNAQMAG